MKAYINTNAQGQPINCSLYMGAETKRPKKQEVLQKLIEVDSKNKLNLLNFTHCTLYYSVYGWDGNWVAYFDNAGEYKDRPHPSEPTGAFSKGRINLKISPKDLK